MRACVSCYLAWHARWSKDCFKVPSCEGTDAAVELIQLPRSTILKTSIHGSLAAVRFEQSLLVNRQFQYKNDVCNTRIAQAVVNKCSQPLESVGIDCSKRSVYGELRMDMTMFCEQLIVMGFFFQMEVVAFIEEAEPDHHGYEDYDDFMKQTKDNYQKIAVNCWIAAVIYFVTLALSYLCIKQAKKNDLLAAENMTDDEAFCRGKPKKS